ncbi:MAG: sodium transporter, partial [Bacteroidota bacterium]
QAVDFQSLGFNGDEFGFWPMLLGGFFLYASYYGTDQSQVQRLFSAQDMGTVKKTLLFNGLLRFPITFVYCIMGLVIGTLVLQDPAFQEAIPKNKPDLMIPIFIRDYLPHGLIGILLVAILSAAMSSLSSAINSLSAATVEDFFNRKKQLNVKTQLSYSKLAALFWGIFCIVLAFFTGDIADTVIEAINKIGSVFYGPILATFIAAIGIKKINATGINLGILAGVLVNIYLWQFVPDVFWFWWNAIGAAVTLFVAWLGSQLKIENSGTGDDIQMDGFQAVFTQTDRKYISILLAFFVVIVLVSISVPSIF